MEIDEMLESKLKAANSIKGDLKGYDCPDCLNRGYITIAVYDELEQNYVLKSKECKCMKERKKLANIQNSGLSVDSKKTFDDYIVTYLWQKDHKEAAMKYCSDNTNKWFIMCGQSGSGKTLLCNIIASTLLKNGKNVRFISWQDYIAEVKRKNMTGETEAAERMLNDVKTAEVVFIDELLKMYNEVDLRYYNEIINYRYNRNLQTIITSEKDLNALMKLDEATISRIIEKAGEYVIVIKKDSSKNYRLKEYTPLSR